MINLDDITNGEINTQGVSDFMELEIDQVYPNPAQPRKTFDDIEELASSIKDKGLIQPIAVIKDGAGKYMIVSGERRYKAIASLGNPTIKAHILTVSSKDVGELTLIENIQRDDLTDIEIAKYISILWNSGQYKQKQDLATAIGKSASYISKAFSCLKLNTQIINDLEENKNDVPLSVLEEISRVKDKDVQVEVYNKYIDGDIVRDDIKSFKSDQKISRGKKEITYEEYMKEQQKEKESFKKIPLNQKLPKTIEKMIYIVRGRTGGSEIYAKMLLSMLPSYNYEVCMNYWCYKSDMDDEQTMLELMQNYSAYKWEYEKLVQPYIEELQEYLGLENG
jgi:ParB/RepB/Spo0J family partition protein